MDIKIFRNHYGLDLIAASHEGITIGDLVWDRLTSTPEFVHKDMPNTIYTAFLDAGLITEEEFNLFQEECKNIPLIKAQLADKKVDVNTELVAELNHPLLGKIEGNFQLESVSKFVFGDIQVKVMDDLLRVKIDQYMELFKQNKWKEYEGRIRRVYMITELYYGTIKLVVERSISEKIDAALSKTGTKILSKAEGSNSVEYEFSHKDVPFAMRIEKIRTFNG